MGSTLFDPPGLVEDYPLPLPLPVKCPAWGKPHRYCCHLPTEDTDTFPRPRSHPLLPLRPLRPDLSQTYKIVH